MKPYVHDPDFTLYVGDVLDVLGELPDESVHCCVTSPPYWGLRDYGMDGQLGLEPTPEAYVARMVEVFAEVRRVLRSDGTFWLNVGDSYAGSWGAQSRENPGGQGASTIQGGSMLSARQIEAHPKGQTRTGSLKNTPGLKQKDLVGIPWRLAFALQADGWYLRSDIIWSKPNPMPESVTDRPTKAHEYVFLLTKSARYFYEADAIREPWADWRGGDPYPNGNRPEQGKYAGVRGDTGITKPPKRGSGPDGRRVTKVEGRDGSAQHRSGERWPHEGGRNKRSVWEIATESYAEAHFATFPQALVEPCVKAGCPEDGTVLDPFMGSGTTALVARRLGRRSVGIELNPEYAELAAKRLSQLSLLAA